MNSKTLKLIALAALAYWLMKQAANKQASELKGGI